MADPHISIALPNRTYQAAARSQIKQLAAGAGLNAKRFSELEIVVAEITSNLVKHATHGGEMLLKLITDDGQGIEIISIDNGPGMDSINAMMEDGVSTSGTLGHGFGTIKRLSDEFDAYSQSGWGTVMLVRIYSKKPALKKQTLSSGTIMVAKKGEDSCGDNYLLLKRQQKDHIVICDGLGHGEAASEAATACLEAFLEVTELEPSAQLREIHRAVRRTRGAVMYIMQFNPEERQINYCGVGNISAKIISAGGKSKGCHSYNGIVGHSIPGTMHSYQIEWERNDLLIMHSDGLNNRWDIQKYPGILKHNRLLLAAALYKDNCRGTDDALVTVIS